MESPAVGFAATSATSYPRDYMSRIASASECDRLARSKVHRSDPCAGIELQSKCPQCAPRGSLIVYTGARGDVSGTQVADHG